MNCGSGQCATPTRLRSASESGTFHEALALPPGLGWLACERLRCHCPLRARDDWADAAPGCRAVCHVGVVRPAAAGPLPLDATLARHEPALGDGEEDNLPDVPGMLGAWDETHGAALRLAWLCLKLCNGWPDPGSEAGWEAGREGAAELAATLGSLPAAGG